MKLLIFSLILLVLIAGCIESEDTEFFKKAAIDACIALCNSTTQDLSNGPCLADPFPDNPGWVCDVAHSPRQSVDDLAENQCSAFREGRASRFVEVDTDCNLIKAV